MTIKSLFLDRDGVLNRRLPGAYVQHWNQWEWLPGVLETFPQLNQLFDRIFIITNQQGIGKGLMTEHELAFVHEQMLTDLERYGARIDAIYYCPHLASDHCDCRKPQPGMINQAKAAFPEIINGHFSLVGDSYSDLQLGMDLGMDTYWVDTKAEDRTKIEATSWALQGRYPSLAQIRW